MFFSKVKREVHGLLTSEFKDMGSVDIAAYLVECGYYGVSTVFDCPMTRFIKANTGRTSVVVGKSYVEIRTKLGPRKIWLPGNVFDFVDDFDRGKYPMLIDRTIAQPVYSPTIL